MCESYKERIVKQGLTEAVAKAFVESWTKDLYGDHPRAFFYTFDRKEIDALMPVKITTQKDWRSEFTRVEPVAVFDPEHKAASLDPLNTEAAELEKAGYAGYGALLARKAQGTITKAETQKISGMAQKLLNEVAKK